MKFKFDIYQRSFKKPLRTSHGLWQVREGIIISLEDREGNVARGEIAPLPWFGTETMTEAIEFCRSLGDKIQPDDIWRISDRLRACQFALESAWLDLTQPTDEELATGDRNLNFCYLLPAGEKALTSWQQIYQTQANSSFKWKIGVYPLATEIALLQQLINAFPAHVKLRLDANGGLNFEQAQALLTVTDNLQNIEFIEQPLAPERFDQILQLSREHSTSLALDESIASFQQLKTAYQQGWRGIFVIKAAIMGFPSQVLNFCQSNSLDIVFSSVFETEVGRRAVLKLAQKTHHPRALGFGLNYFV